MQKSSKPDRTPYQIAVDYLSRREHSRRELLQKLLKKGCDQCEAQTAVERLAASGLQSDERFVEAFVQSKVSRGIGPARILYEVQQQVDDTSLVERVLDELDINWKEIARSVYRKKYKNEAVADYQEKSRRMRFLQSRGFSGALIRELME